jgi:hypothetical protein
MGTDGAFLYPKESGGEGARRRGPLIGPSGVVEVVAVAGNDASRHRPFREVGRRVHHFFE